MNTHTCCFTGHRSISENKLNQIQNRLASEIIRLIQQGVYCFNTGGELGFDTEAALTVLTMKRIYPHIRLILVLPCREQTRGWSKKDIATYNHILENADKVIYTSQVYYQGCMHVRNRYLVDYACFCLCYLTKATGGVAYTMQYAEQKGLTIINLAK